jgi:hypothetical protein
MGLPLILSSYLGAGVLVLAGTGLAGAVWPHGPLGRRTPLGPEETDRALPAGLRRLVLASTLVGTALILLALGRHNPLLTSPSGEALGGAVLRYPERLLPLAGLAVAVAAAAGWQVISAARRDGRRLPRSWWIALGGMVLVLAAVSVAAATRRLYSLLGVELPGEELRQASVFLLQSCSMGLLGLALVAACVWLAGRRGWEGLAAAFCPLLLGFDLLAVNVSLNPTVNPQTLREIPAAAVAIRESTAGVGFPPRLLRLSHPPLIIEETDLVTEVAWWRRTLSDRIPTAYGIGTCLVKDVDRSAPVGHAFLRVAYQQAAGASRERLADRAAAGWELGFARSPGELPAGARLVDRAFSGAAGIWLLERPGALPVADVVPRGVALGSLREAETLPRLLDKLGDSAVDPRQEVYLTGHAARSIEGRWNPGDAEVSVARQSPVELVLEALLPGPGVLVVRQSLTPGWTVEVDGEAAKIFRADLAWRGVPLEKGRHTVRFAFHQPGLTAGALTSAAGLLLCGSLLAAHGVRRRRMEGGSPGAGAAGIRSYDFGWHLRAGDWILSHGGRPPATDPIAYTSAGRSWVDHEWLFQAILAGLVGTGGLFAAWMLKQACILLAVLIPAVWLVRRGMAPLPVALLAILALAGARFRFFVRPELAGLLLLPTVLILLETARGAARRGRSPWPTLLPLPILILLWVNLHPSALLGAGIVALYALSIVLEERGLSATAGSFLLFSAACVATLLANPYGGRVLEIPLRIRSALAGGLMVNPEWGSPFRWAFLHFWLVLVVLATAVGIALWRRVQISVPMAICGLALAAAAAATLRLVGLFYVALPVLVGGTLDAKGLGRAREVLAKRAATAAALSLPPLAAIFFLLVPEGAPPGIGLAPHRFPEAMAATYKEAGLQGPIYNPVRFGGYLAWRLAPEKVFIDGRNELHAPMLSRMAACRVSTRLDCWDELLDEWGVEVAFVEYDPRTIVVRLPDGTEEQRTLSSVYFRREEWSLMDWDDVAMLLVRHHVAAELPSPWMVDRLLTPEDPSRFTRLLATGQVDPEEALAEVRRRLDRHPESRRARFLEGAILEALSRPVGRPRSTDLTAQPGAGGVRPPAEQGGDQHDSQRPRD